MKEASNNTLISQVLQKCEFFKENNFWLPEPKMRPRLWIKNFDEEDQYVAAYLLDAFTFFNGSLVDQLFRSAYRSIGDGTFGRPSLANSLSDACVTPVTGEIPNPTDSGWTFSRKARQVLRISEDRVMGNSGAIQEALSGRTIVFVDDIVGSGNQFLETWRRVDSVSQHSFQSVSNIRQFSAIYVALASTEDGLKRIQIEAPGVTLAVAHVLGKSSTFLALTGVDQLKIENFLEKYHDRLKPREKHMQSKKHKKYGFDGCGLMLSFQHSTPDLTLPIFWAEGENPEWVPLIERI